MCFQWLDITGLLLELILFGIFSEIIIKMLAFFGSPSRHFAPCCDQQQKTKKLVIPSQLRQRFREFEMSFGVSPSTDTKNHSRILVGKRTEIDFDSSRFSSPHSHGDLIQSALFVSRAFLLAR